MSSPQPTSQKSETPVNPATKNDSLSAEFIAAIRAGNIEAMSQAWDRTDEASPAQLAATVRAISQGGLVEQLLNALVRESASAKTVAAAQRAATAGYAFGNEEVAFAAASETLRRDPQNGPATCILAVIANSRNQSDIALTLINELPPELKLQPNLVLQTAIAQLGTKDPEAALATLDHHANKLVTGGLAFDAQFVRARALGSLGNRNDAALQAWEAALSVATPDQANLVRYEYGAALLLAKRFEDAMRQLELAVQAGSDQSTLAALHEARASVFLASGDAQGALSAIEDQLANEFGRDKRVDLRLKQAQIAATLKQVKESAGYFDAAMAEAEDPEKRFAFRLAKVQALAGYDYELVEPDLNELDKADTGENWPPAIDIRIGGLLAGNRPEEALLWLNHRLNALPALADHPAAHQVRGDIEMKRGNVEAAMEQYALAAQIPSGTEDTRAWGAALMGAFTTQQWMLATSVYEQYAKLSPLPVDPATRVTAAVAYARTNQPQIALQLTEGDEPLLPLFSFLKLQARAEAQLRLGKHEDVLKTTEDIEKQNASPDFLLGAQLMRVQAFNQLKRFAEAERTATGVLNSFTDSSTAIQGLMPFLRLGVLVQRSLAFFSLNEYRKAHGDLNDAVSGFEALRSSAAVKMLERATEFASFESSIWYAKGAVFDAERRNDEALNAYNRSFVLETIGCSAAIARGYALCKVGSFSEAVDSFDVALSRVTSSNDQAMALAGKGLTFVRLRNFEEAITTLQAALDVRLAEPESDDAARRDETSVIFEYLGIAYSELNRNSAALNSFERAWKLTSKDQRNKERANVARGISAARLKLDFAAKILDEWDQLHEELQNDPKLLFNRALALEATGKRSEAMKNLVLAKTLGLRQAQELLNQLDRPTGLNRWTREWFGVQVSPGRRNCGAALLVIAALGLGAPVYKWLITKQLDWYLLLFPSAVAFLLFALPSLRSIKAAGVELTAEPLAATGRDASTPETFSIPTFAAPIAAEGKFV